MIEKREARFHCRVCGDRHESRSSLESHLREAHVSGRDYFLCPVCGESVSALDVHLAAKHGVPLPSPEERRTTPPKDWDLTRKRARRRGPKFRSGLFKSQKNGRNVHYRSGLELRVYRALERCEAVVEYREEPFRIEYRVGGEDRGYWPDIAVLLSDGRRLLIEVKPASQTSDPTNLAKWRHATAYANRRGYEFRVWTERMIDRVSSTPSVELTPQLLCE